MPYCRYCGSSTTEQDKFCPLCGKPKKADQEELPQVYYKTIPLKEKFCANCGKSLPMAVQFCGECGTRNTQQREQKLPYCVLCDELLPESAQYCTLCGIQYVENSNGYVEIPTKSTCGACGAVMVAETAFCTTCGASAENKRPERVRKAVPACRSCGTPFNVSSTYCKNCGKKISEKVTFQNRTAADNRAAGTSGVYYRPIVEGDTIRCPGCGFGDMKKDRTICWNCGVKFTKIDD